MQNASTYLAVAVSIGVMTICLICQLYTGILEFHLKPKSVRIARDKLTQPKCKCIRFEDPVIRKYCNKRGHDTVASYRSLYLKPIARLGNVLFQLASSYALAKDTGSNLRVVDDPYLNIFEDQPFESITQNQFDKLNITHIRGDVALNQYVKAFQKLSSDSVKLRHYMIRYTFFSGCKEEIRQRLRFRQDIIDKADRAISNIASLYQNDDTSKRVTTIGIHVRRGDLLEKQKLGYNVPEVPYFHKGYEVLPRSLPKCCIHCGNR